MDVQTIAKSTALRNGSSLSTSLPLRPAPSDLNARSRNDRLGRPTASPTARPVPASTLATVTRRVARRPVVRAVLLVAPLVASDVLALVLSTLLAFGTLRLLGPLVIRDVHLAMSAVAASLVLGYLSAGLYAVVGINPVVELRQLTRLNTLVLLAALMTTYVAGSRGEWRIFFLVEWAASLVLLPLFRAQARGWAARRRWWPQPALVFSSAAAADAVIARLLEHPTGGLRPVAVVTPDPRPGTPVDRRRRRRPGSKLIPTLTLRHAERLARSSGISYGIAVADDDPAARLAAISAVSALHLSHLLVMTPAAATDTPTLWTDSRELGGMTAVQVRNKLLLPLPRLIKRTTDVTLTLLLGTLLLPLLGCIALAVKMTSTGPVYYGHNRIGVGGRRFKAWKFRSMHLNSATLLASLLATDTAASEEWRMDQKLRCDPRVTTIGRTLRKLSLDELPQLWNVLKGDMSLVGPRPIVDEEIGRYGSAYTKYLLVKPGITGLWQVSGRNDISYSERVALDRYYVQNWSPWLDLYLLARTASVLSGSRGAY